MFSFLRNRIKGVAGKIYWKEIFSLCMLLVAIYFFRSEKRELQDILPQIGRAKIEWLIAGLFFTGAYIFLQAGIYRQCFAAIGISLKWSDTTELYLKRNLLSIFLPAGGISSLACTPSQLRKKGLRQMQIHQASALFGFMGLLSVFLVGVPVIIYSVSLNGRYGSEILALLFIVAVLTSFLFIGRSLSTKRFFYHWIEKKFPSAIPTIDELFSANINRKQFTLGIFYSLGVELCGILHVYIAMKALGLSSSFGISAVAYIISVLMMIMSPFLRGLGAVELAMVFILQKFGATSIHSLAITMLYRVFEFWLPMVAGIISFAWKGRHIVLRLVPAVLTFMLGIINIISVVTPPLNERLRLIREYIPLSAIHASNFMTLFIGLMLLVTSGSLIRGMKNAWIIALILSTFSLLGHLLKALDYEEGIFSALVILILFLSAGQYRIKSSSRWLRIGIVTVALVFTAVIAFGFTGFSFMDIKHFGVKFTPQQSLFQTLRVFLLVEDDNLHPVTRFGKEFVLLIRILGFMAWAFLLFALIRPKLFSNENAVPSIDRANAIMEKYGKSSTDYFKVYKDKLLFFSELHEAFIAYRIAGGFAIVLEEPVCMTDHKLEVTREFEWHCRKMGLKTAFYRVDESSIVWFNELRKRKLVIGQEAILELNLFSLEGKNNKSLRNALNSLNKKGYSTIIHFPPYSPDFLEELKLVSDEWLVYYHKNESIFSQGMFDNNELLKQDIITLEDAEGRIKAFLNIIPDYTPDECTYDLIRKTSDSPGGSIDALIIKLIEYAKSKNLHFLNMGLVPMHSEPSTENTAEQLMKLAVKKLRLFRHYGGLRDFKSKYATIWENKYLVYENDFDLLLLPNALHKVIQP